MDYRLYPSKETQLQWLHSYLQAYKQLTQGGQGGNGVTVSEKELEALYVQVNKFSLVSAGGGRWEGTDLIPVFSFSLTGFRCCWGLTHRAWLCSELLSSRERSQIVLGEDAEIAVPVGNLSSLLLPGTFTKMIFREG